MPVVSFAVLVAAGAAVLAVPSTVEDGHAVSPEKTVTYTFPAFPQTASGGETFIPLCLGVFV